MHRKVELTTTINFIFSKDAEEDHVMHSSSDNVEFTPYSDANDVIDKLFKSLCLRSQENLETSIKGRDIFSIQLN